MKPTLSFFILIISVSGLLGQELDFLDKVNEKPKPVVVPKPAEEEEGGIKKPAVTTTTAPTTGKKKKEKEKKKKNGQLPASEISPVTTVPPTTTPPITNSTSTKPITTATVPVPQNPNPVVQKPTNPTNVIETEVIDSSPALAMWLEPEIKIEPTELPGFASDSDNAVSLEKTTQEKKPLDKEGSGFSGFFDKYKKAMLILGFIILFAFYRAKMSRPSSNPRSYRK